MNRPDLSGIESAARERLEDRINKGAENLGEEGFAAMALSIAISLKRIADAIEEQMKLEGMKP